MPVQFVVPDTQVTVHAPAEHTWPDAHTTPQAPQLRRSVLRSWQVPEQSTCPAGHEVTHRPAVHT